MALPGWLGVSDGMAGQPGVIFSFPNFCGLDCAIFILHTFFFFAKSGVMGRR